VILDAAAMGRVHVERDGVSHSHDARFVLIGTMNPEEGELRPQLLDRFGLTVDVAAPRDPGLRAEVVRRRLAYDADPDTLAVRFAAEESELVSAIVTAQALLASVELSDAALNQITSVCAAFDVDGLRADLVMARAALAHAAWSGRTSVDSDDVRVAARLALPHRKRRNPFDAPGIDDDQLDDALRNADPGDGPDDDGSPNDDGPSDGGSPPDAAGVEGEPTETGDAPEPTRQPGSGSAGEQAPQPPAPPFRAKLLSLPDVGRQVGAAGRRSRSASTTGRTTRAERPIGRLTRLHLAATVQAAAPYQRERGRVAGGLRLRTDDLRQAHVEGREGNLVLFVVDASGSMAARSRMSAVTGAILSLLLDAYQRRDKVGLITFRGSSADLVLPPTPSVDAAAARISALPTGGRTPLAAGLLRAHEVLRVERLRDPQRRALLVVVTDGRATAPAGEPAALPQARLAAALLQTTGVASVVIDCESGPIRLGLAAELATTLGGTWLRLTELAAGPLADTVRELRGVA
jgi:magnesium chelatase subunit D